MARYQVDFELWDRDEFKGRRIVVRDGASTREIEVPGDAVDCDLCPSKTTIKTKLVKVLEGRAVCDGCWSNIDWNLWNE